MFIVVTNIQANYNPNAMNFVFTVLSSGGTNTTVETFCDSDATVTDIHEAIGAEARQACRARRAAPTVKRLMMPMS